MYLPYTPRAYENKPTAPLAGAGTTGRPWPTSSGRLTSTRQSARPTTSQPTSAKSKFECSLKYNH